MPSVSASGPYNTVVRYLSLSSHKISLGQIYKHINRQLTMGVGACGLGDPCLSTRL